MHFKEQFYCPSTSIKIVKANSALASPKFNALKGTISLLRALNVGKAKAEFALTITSAIFPIVTL